MMHCSSYYDPIGADFVGTRSRRFWDVTIDCSDHRNVGVLHLVPQHTTFLEFSIWAQDCEKLVFEQTKICVLQRTPFLAKHCLQGEPAMRLTNK
jgi:hypothetical protein